MDDPEVINFLLSTEIIPLCLRIMETGSELSKTVTMLIAPTDRCLIRQHAIPYLADLF
jgi:CCR4-NOT transcription complex subunit 9